MNKKRQHKPTNAIIAFVVFLFSFLSALPAFSNVPSHHFNLKTETWPNGNVVEHDYDGANRKIASRDSEGPLGNWKHDADGNLLEETDGNGNTTTHSYDAISVNNSRRTLTVYPALPGATTRRHSYTYDKVGNRTGETDPSGNTFTHTYNELNLRTKTTDSVGAVGEYNYDKVGNLTSEKNGLGETTTHTYDNLNRRIKQSDNLGTTWTKTFDKAGNLVEETDGKGIKTRYTYDRNNRKLTTTRADLRVETLEYDPAGNVLFRTDARNTKEGWEYDPRNLIIAHNRPLAMIVRTTRDNMGDIVEERDPEGRLTQNTWNKRRKLASSTINNETTRYTYDANNNPTKTTRPEGGSTEIVYTAHNQPHTITTSAGQSRWAYNNNGAPTSRTDARGNTTNYTVDQRNRRTEITYAGNTGTTRYTWDLANRLKTTVENGITTTHTYDTRGRETQRTYSGGSLTRTVYSYDANGNRTSEAVTDNSGTRTTTTQYDAFNRPEIVTDTFGNRLQHTYDPNGNKRTTTAPGISGNQVTTYTWDVNDNLTNLSSGSANIGWTYDRSGKVTRTSYTGGVTTEQSWDGAARLTSRTHKTSSGTQQSFAYTYDKNGNRTNETRNLGTNTEAINYDYDAADRLTNVTHSDGKSEIYVLDASGNRAQVIRSGYASDNGTTVNTFDARGRIETRQTPSGTINYTWDAAGNLKETRNGSQTTTYTWDAENQLTSIQQNGSPIASYRYTGGLRDQIQSGGETNRTVWDENFAFINQDSGGNTLTRTEHAGLKALFLSGAGANEVLLRDGLDSITGSVSGGTLQSKTDYSAWGEANTTGTTQTNHGYTGHLQDETGLIYARARYYDPSIGRFISRDPLEGILDNPISWNAYLYANANPFYYIDPTGESATVTGVGIGTAWGFGQMIGAMVYDTYSHVRYDTSFRDSYLDIMVQNAAAGAAMGASVDMAVLSAGWALPVSGALGGAGAGMMTFGGQASSADQLMYEGGMGAAFGAVGGVAFAKAAPWIAQTRVGQWTGVQAERIAASEFGQKTIAAAQRGGTWVEQKVESVLTKEASSLGTSFEVNTVTRGVGAQGDQAIKGVNLRVVNNEPSSLGNFVKNSPGVTVQRVGNYWIKEVDQSGNALSRWYGRQSIKAQAKGLEKLEDMGTSFLYRDGKIITRDAGNYTPGQFWSTWSEGSRRLGTPFNDIRYRNIGADGIIFDPAKVPLHQGIEAVGSSLFVGGVGYVGYQYWRAP
ncbi:MAG: hypothetical protein LBE32_01555 [Burkholderiales bacterium]|jgi:RHS repeat-associated protein|nr:hypothetical protein [Burkholderiales bacterium]